MRPVGSVLTKVIVRLAEDNEQRLAALAASLDDACTIDDSELHAAVTLARLRAIRLLSEARNDD